MKLTECVHLNIYVTELRFFCCYLHFFSVLCTVSHLTNRERVSTKTPTEWNTTKCACLESTHTETREQHSMNHESFQLGTCVKIQYDVMTYEVIINLDSIIVYKPIFDHF